MSLDWVLDHAERITAQEIFEDIWEFFAPNSRQLRKIREAREPPKITDYMVYTTTNPVTMTPRRTAKSYISKVERKAMDDIAKMQRGRMKI